MLFWKYSSNRIFFINEYWILVPSVLLTDYFIIRKMRSHKKKIEELQKLKEHIERYKKLQRLRRVLAVSLSGASGVAMFNILKYRNGAYIDVDYIDCGVEEGLRYLDNDRIRKIIHDLYANKRRGKIIYITATAVCHLAKTYGKDFLALPFTIGDFGLTNVYQTTRKIFVTVLLGAVGPLYVAGGPIAIVVAVLLATGGLKLAFTDLEKLPTSFIDETLPISQIKPRIPDLPDVVTVNYRNRVKAPSIVPAKQECWLPEQAYLNPNCQIKPTQIPTAVNQAPPELVYDEVVNMQDTTGLDRVDFSDILDLGQPETTISKASKGKTVNFLDLFGDPADVDESDTWDASSITDTVAKSRNSRIKE